MYIYIYIYFEVHPANLIIRIPYGIVCFTSLWTKRGSRKGGDEADDGLRFCSQAKVVDIMS